MFPWLSRPVLYQVLQFICLIAVCSTTQAAIFYVSPSGSDSANGRSPGNSGADGAVATLQAAVSLAVKFRQSNKSEVIGIVVAPGTYRLEQPVIIPASLSGTKDAPTIIHALQPGTVWLNGGKSLGPPREMTPDERRRFSGNAASNVRVYDLIQQHVSPFGLAIHGTGLPDVSGPSELFFNHDPMEMARWPKNGFAKISSLTQDSGAPSIRLTDVPPGNLANESGMWAVGYWAFDYAMQYLPVTADANGPFIHLREQPHSGIKNGQRAYLVNVASALSAPGEYYLDVAQGKIFFWPPNNTSGSLAEVPQADSLFQINGAKYVDVWNLSFELARGTAVQLNNVENVQLGSCEIRNVGGMAAGVNGINSGVSSCTIHDVGAGGIQISGGNRATLSPGGSFANRNRVFRFNRWNRTYHPGIGISGVGNIIRNNLIYEAPHVAIVLYGNDHLIELNEIHDVDQETADSGAIYMGRDWTMRGNVIRNNYLHDIQRADEPNTNGIYLDDQFSGTSIVGNIFFRVSNAIFIGGGRDNQVQGNLFVDCSSAVRIDQRGTGWEKAVTSDPNGVFRKNLAAVPYQSPAYAKYQHLGTILNDDPGAAKYNSLTDNVMVRSTCLNDLDISLQPQNHASPAFTNNACLQNSSLFQFQKNSTVAAKSFVIPSSLANLPKGFTPIPVDGIGIPANH